FSWDVRISRPLGLGRQGQFEAIVEIFNLTNTDNFKDPAYGGLLFNFDGTLRSGLGDPRQLQAGARWRFCATRSPPFAASPPGSAVGTAGCFSSTAPAAS